VDYVAWADFEPTGIPPCTDYNIGDIVLPYQYLGGTTCGMGNDWQNTCLGSYDGGEDFIFEFNLLAQTTVNITMDPHGATWTGIAIDDECPFNLSTCIATSTGSSGTRMIYGLSLAPGTYWIMVDTWPSPDCIPEFDLTIEETPPPGPGDSCDDPYIIPSFPYSDAGNSCSYQDNCDITGSDNFDVIYKMTIAEPTDLELSMCSSSYDTKLAVFANDCCTGAGTEMYYNDDYCGLQSYIFGHFEPGVYYVVVDGYSTACGEYVLDITPFAPCVVECPPSGIPEGEPDCGPNYVDNFNGGCNSSPYVFSPIACWDTICGASGVFDYNGLTYRDTDWYQLEVTQECNLTWSGVADFGLLLFIMDAGSGNCADYTILTYGTASPCDTLNLSWFVAPGTYWLWAGPSEWNTDWACPRDYVAWVGGECCPPPQACCDVEMVPDTSPVIVPQGGSFWYTGTVGNPSQYPMITDVWVGIKWQNVFYEARVFPDIALDPYEYISSHLLQYVCHDVCTQTFMYYAFCGDHSTMTVCDSVWFPVTVTHARIADGPDTWVLEGEWGVKDAIPTEFNLVGSYPNPFNATTTIIYDLPTKSNVTLEVYNLMGQRVAALVNGSVEAGRHDVAWDATIYSSGVYFYKLTAGDKVFTKRMTLLK